jgi:plasmid stabilization system protein ParE
MRFRVTILPRAKIDIDQNADWWADHRSTDQAVKWSDAIYDQIETLTAFPESNALSAENGRFPYEIRDKLVGLGSRKTYRAVFTIKDDEVFVLTVRAAEEDRLSPDDVDFD